MRQYPKRSRILFAAMPLMALAVGLTATQAVAGSPRDSGDRLSASKYARVATLHRRHEALRELHDGLRPGPLAASPNFELARFRHEACNLPTSTCPNSERDGQ